VSKPQRNLSFDRGVWRSLAEKRYTGVRSDVVRGPAICGAVGGDRSAVSAEEAIPAVKRRSPAPPQTLAATFKARERTSDFGRNPLDRIRN